MQKNQKLRKNFLIDDKTLNLTTFIISFVMTIVTLLSQNRSDKINRAIVNCQSVLIEFLKSEIYKISSFFQKEVETKTFKMPDFSKKAKDNEIVIDKPNIEINNRFIRDIRNANNLLNQLERALFRIKIIRCIFIVLLTFATINLFLNIVFKVVIPYSWSMTFCLITLIVFVVTVIDYLITDNCLDEVSKRYGLSL